MRPQEETSKLLRALQTHYLNAGFHQGRIFQARSESPGPHPIEGWKRTADLYIEDGQKTLGEIKAELEDLHQRVTETGGDLL